jgi:ketol-acid reductoisomerase
MAEGGSRGEPRPAATRAAMIGYGPEAREQAVRLRAIGWNVGVAMRPGGLSWIRAVDDGFRPVPSAEAVASAEVVVIQLPEPRQPSVWAYGLAPYVEAGSLVVFARGTALYSGAVDPDPSLDVVLVTSDDGPSDGGAQACRVAIHSDASGYALERAMAFARAAFRMPRIGTTTVDSEVGAELAEWIVRAGGLTALLAEWDCILANPSHEPDQATLTYYERLRAKVLEGHGWSMMKAPKSGSGLVERARDAASRKRGAA